MFDEYNPLEGKRLEIMNPEGEIISGGLMPDISDERVVEAYRTMVYARLADIKAVSYQRQGRLYTLPSNIGQEAAAVGSAMTLEKGDWMVPAYRELGAWLVHGCTMLQYFLYFGGSEEACRFPAEVNMLPISVPISSQLPHAAGLGHSIVYKGGKEVVLAYFGDGGTSEGDFHEALNWAAVFNCPVVFFCNNNGYAISLPRHKQTKAATLAQKAIAYGIPGIQVDGNDFFAVYSGTHEAVLHARNGKGPVMIEAVTYRRGAHTTSDDPSRYRTAEEESSWEARDPLGRLRAFLEKRGLWSEEKEDELSGQLATEIDGQFAEFEARGDTPIEDIFGYMFESMPDSLKRQMVELHDFYSRSEG
jgi:pyruvate dehydrogenase E1 component alpha subunit